jgi:predicted  nucleic acid-binding Zn-ribbon protein
MKRKYINTETLVIALTFVALGFIFWLVMTRLNTFQKNHNSLDQQLAVVYSLENFQNYLKPLTTISYSDTTKIKKLARQFVNDPSLASIPDRLSVDTSKLAFISEKQNRKAYLSNLDTLSTNLKLVSSALHVLTNEELSGYDQIIALDQISREEKSLSHKQKELKSILKNEAEKMHDSLWNLLTASFLAAFGLLIIVIVWVLRKLSTRTDTLRTLQDKLTHLKTELVDEKKAHKKTEKRVHFLDQKLTNVYNSLSEQNEELLRSRQETSIYVNAVIQVLIPTVKALSEKVKSISQGNEKGKEVSSFKSRVEQLKETLKKLKNLDLEPSETELENIYLATILGEIIEENKHGIDSFEVLDELPTAQISIVQFYTCFTNIIHFILNEYEHREPGSIKIRCSLVETELLRFIIEVPSVKTDTTNNLIKMRTLDDGKKIPQLSIAQRLVDRQGGSFEEPVISNNKLIISFTWQSPKIIF